MWPVIIALLMLAGSILIGIAYDWLAGVLVGFLCLMALLFFSGGLYTLANQLFKVED